MNFVPGKRGTLIGLAVVFAAAGLLLFNSFYGIGTPDEAFYPILPFRFLRGARPFIDEWHVSQLSAFLQYPFVKLFVGLTGSADGIILYFRALFILVQLAFSCLVFLRMKKNGFACALTGTLLFELFAAECTLSLDYYTLSLFAILAVWLVLFSPKKPGAANFVFAGAFFACAVLAEPPFVIVYVFWFAAVVVSAALRKRPHPALALKPFALITAGIAAVAAVFFAWLFMRMTPSEFLANFFNVFRSGEYSVHTLGVGYGNYAQSLLRDFSWTAGAAAVYIAAIIIDRGRGRRRLMWTYAGLTIFAVMMLMTVIGSVKNSNLLSFISPPFAVAFMGLAAYILSENRKKELLVLWIFGLGYTVTVAVGSESMIYAGSYGFVFSDIASVPMIFGLCEELSVRRRDKKRRRGGSFARSNPSRDAFRPVPVCAAVLLVCVLGI
ncbi:MAG: hypothetical protein K6C36_07815, partial [Clostridia bacterium]|nr:hypothetical protein [Clostridia bacterium]